MFTIIAKAAKDKSCNMFVKSVNSLLKILLDADQGLTDVVTMNPGFTTGGKAKNKIFTSESDGSRLTTNYQRILNGWKITNHKINGLLEQINREAGRMPTSFMGLFRRA